jgi:pyruvate dehydrogenase E1 component beta subunit
VTVVAYGPSVKTAIRAAEAAAGEGRSLEVIDARSIAPLDTTLMTQSLRKTGRLVVVSEATATASVASEIVARLSEECFYFLRAPGVRVAGFHVPYPPSRIEEEFLPNVDRILDAVDRVMDFDS